MSPREVKRTLLPRRTFAANIACPKHGPTFLAGPNKQGNAVCLSCGWTTPYDHRDVLTPRTKPTRVR